MQSPKQVKKVLEQLRTYCPDIKTYDIKLVEKEGPTEYMSLNFSLNVFPCQSFNRVKRDLGTLK